MNWTTEQIEEVLSLLRAIADMAEVMVWMLRIIAFIGVMSIGRYMVRVLMFTGSKIWPSKNDVSPSRL